MRRSSRFGAWLASGWAALAGWCCGACGERGTADAAAEDPGEVVLYSSADDYLLREVAADFAERTGATLRVVGDTEATKTTGLMQRVLSERGAPRADVWWSSEASATIALAREGLLEPVTIEDAEAAAGGAWPEGLRGEGGAWYGFALRARVIAYRTEGLDLPLPTTLRALTAPEWRGRVGIARPEFGTTRSHLAAIVATDGEEALEAWLTAMRENGVRVYSSNSAVVRAIADGEIVVALTDTDDVFAAQRNGWPVGLVYEQPDADAAPAGTLPSHGAMVIPNTVALVRGGPNREGGEQLMAYLLGPDAARVMAESDSHNLPVLPDLSEEYARYGPGASAWTPDAEAVADAVPAALAVVERVLGGG